MIASIVPKESAVLRLVLVLALAALAPWQADAQNRLSSSAQIDEYLAEQVSTTHIPGIVALVVDADGVLYRGAFGEQDSADHVPMSPDAIFRIASMTKPITSVAVMMLVQQGDVALDDPVADYLPAFEDLRVIESVNLADKTYTSRPAARPLTIRHLLTHTSGLGYTFASPTLAALLAPGESATSLPLLHDPGAKWTYGESTRVLGTLVEEVTGQPLDEFIDERILAPLGMNDTSYSVPPAKRGRVVTVHRRTETGFDEVRNPEQISAPAFGDGGLHSTASDYAKFIQLFLNNGRTPSGTRLLSEATVLAMGQNHIGRLTVDLQPTTNRLLSEPFPLGAGRDTFGLGFQIAGPSEERFTPSPGSMSWAGIYNTQFWIDPARGIGGVLLMQYLPFYDGAAIETLRGFERRVYQGLVD
jgi:methyl acetate hydrolase